MGQLRDFPETRIDEIADGVFRIATAAPGTGADDGFSFNRYLVRDEAPLLFHTSMGRLFEATRAAIATVLPPESLRYVAFAHFEADECGALNEFLALAPEAEAVCGQIGAMTSIGEFAIRPPKALADGEDLAIGERTLTWIDAPHVPHGWDNGFLADRAGGVLFCGDLFTQPGATHAPLTRGDILEPSEEMRATFDYFAHGPSTGPVLDRLAAMRPRTLACMHGSAFEGDGASLIRALGRRLAS